MNGDGFRISPLTAPIVHENESEYMVFCLVNINAGSQLVARTDQTCLQPPPPPLESQHGSAFFIQAH